MGHPFCKTCGVHVYMNVYGPPQDIVDRLPEAKKVFVGKQLELQPVSLRILEGVSLGDLSIQRSDGGAQGY
jgi:hypothetical protein